MLEEHVVRAEARSMRLPLKGALFFVCGPEPMMRACRAALAERGVPGAQIFEERFNMPHLRRRARHCRREQASPQLLTILVGGRTAGARALGAQRDRRRRAGGLRSLPIRRCSKRDLQRRDHHGLFVRHGRLRGVQSPPVRRRGRDGRAEFALTASASAPWGTCSPACRGVTTPRDDRPRRRSWLQPPREPPSDRARGRYRSRRVPVPHEGPLRTAQASRARSFTSTSFRGSPGRGEDRAQHGLLRRGAPRAAQAHSPASA